LDRAHAHGVGALILPFQLHSTSKPVIHVENPRMAFGMILAMTARPLPIQQGIHPTAIISEHAFVHESASVGPYCVVDGNARIGGKAKIYAFSYVGDGCSIGAGSVLFPSVVLYQDVTLGERVVIHSGVVLGADGFGFMWDGKKHFKVPQVGGVLISDDCEIGANATVDRATAGVTKIGTGTKLDNHVQVAHNVSIGRDGVIASLTGIAGSVQIGDRVVIGGQTGVADHIRITDDVTLGGRAGASSDILEKGAYFGNPAIPAGDGLRAYLLAAKLPDLHARLKSLEKKVKELEGNQ
jgi:UDP-3-O-[3-hydroxymyristoyl] glucosamine N-acyltransferase